MKTTRWMVVTPGNVSRLMAKARAFAKVAAEVKAVAT